MITLGEAASWKSYFEILNKQTSSIPKNFDSGETTLFERKHQETIVGNAEKTHWSIYDTLQYIQ